MSATFAIRDGVPYVGDRAFPWASKVTVSDTHGWSTRHFWLRFENGWILSVTFGSGTYSANRENGLFGNGPFIEEPETAECWGWYGDSTNDHWKLNDGDPLGWQTAAEILSLIDEMQTWASA